MDSRTLTFYLLAGGLSIALSAVLLVVARLRPGSHLAGNSAVAILLFALALVVFGMAPSLPRWVVVMGANLALIAAWNIMFAGFNAYFAQRVHRFDRVGWAVVALTVLPFWYWGLVEPNGNYRVAVFSFAMAAISVRMTLMMVRVEQKRHGKALHRVLAVLFFLITLWMFSRGVLSLWAPAAPPDLRGANPTVWLTVFTYIVVISTLAACILWMEINHPTAPDDALTEYEPASRTLAEYFRQKMLLLWAVLAIAVLAIVSESGVIYTEARAQEEVHRTQAAALTNDALAQYTLQVINQADLVLSSVKNDYQRTHSMAETARFIQALPIDWAVMGDVYLIDAQGYIAIARDPQAVGRSVANNDYFMFHRAQTSDPAFIGAVVSGRVSGSFYLPVSRRITHADGSFGGVVLANVHTQALAGHFKEVLGGAQDSVGLLGTLDRKFRQRVPELPTDRWHEPLESPLWAALAQSPQGSYRSVSSVDHIERIFVYKSLDRLPLVMVTGFSTTEMLANVQQRMRWPALGAVTLLFIVLAMSLLLGIEIRRRNEQDNFMAMLSHELKTPLSVLRMALELAPPLSDGSRKHAQQAVHDMNTIIERCLQADRMERRRHIPSPQRCSLRELLDELQMANPEGKRLQINVPDLAALTADVPLLRIVLHNLMDNALKYSPAASAVEITARAHAYRRRNGILLGIRNTPGMVGMPDARKVFTKYYRSPSAHRKTGSGLGLYLVHNAARALGGWVRYVQGSDRVCFELWLPA